MDIYHIISYVGCISESCCSSFPAAQTQVIDYLLFSWLVPMWVNNRNVLLPLVEAPQLSYFVTKLHPRKRHINVFPQHIRLKASSIRCIIEAETLSKCSPALALRRNEAFSKLVIFRLRFFQG